MLRQGCGFPNSVISTNLPTLLLKRLPIAYFAVLQAPFTRSIEAASFLMYSTDLLSWHDNYRSDIFPNGDREYVHPGRHCLDLNSLPTIKFNRFGTQDERNSPSAANLLAAKRLAYHYLVFAHDQPLGFSGSSGVASLPGMDTLVTLGRQGWALNPVSNHPVGTLDEQAATVMHEFGHNLKLRHSGNFDLPNCEPNYFSVMNYAFQFSNWVSNRPLDYSRSALATLDIELLNERNGVGQSTPPGLTTVYGPATPGRGLVPHHRCRHPN